MMNRIQQIDFKKGSTEVLGFLMMLGIFLGLLVFIISVEQLGYANETLRYAVYAAGRAACVSSDMDSAMGRAQQAAEESIEGRMSGIKPGSVNTKINLIDGEQWEKGSYFELELSVDLDTMSNTRAGTKVMKIAMLVEKGGDEDEVFGSSETADTENSISDESDTQE